MKIVYRGFCDVGLKRDTNQDSILTFANPQNEMYLFVVADGMGGHMHGEKASGAITRSLSDWCETFSPDNYNFDFQKIVVALQNRLQEVNGEIFRELNQTQVCGSTCVILLIYGDCYATLSVGDSRIYQARGFRYRQITEDDVWENQRKVKESLTKKEILNHPDFGKLVLAVGVDETVPISRETDMLKKGDAFLLCSDGLYKFCKESTMKKAMKTVSEKNINTLIDKMATEVYLQGAKDNISIILVKCM